MSITRTKRARSRGLPPRHHHSTPPPLSSVTPIPIIPTRSAHTNTIPHNPSSTVCAPIPIHSLPILAYSPTHRWMRPIACSSKPKLMMGSRRKACVASVNVSPACPEEDVDRMHIKRQWHSGSDRKVSNASSLSFPVPLAMNESPAKGAEAEERAGKGGERMKEGAERRRERLEKRRRGGRKE